MSAVGSKISKHWFARIPPARQRFILLWGLARATRWSQQCLAANLRIESCWIMLNLPNRNNMEQQKHWNHCQTQTIFDILWWETDCKTGSRMFRSRPHRNVSGAFWCSSTECRDILGILGLALQVLELEVSTLLLFRAALEQPNARGEMLNLIVLTVHTVRAVHTEHTYYAILCQSSCNKICNHYAIMQHYNTLSSNMFQRVAIAPHGYILYVYLCIYNTSHM